MRAFALILSLIWAVFGVCSAAKAEEKPTVVFIGSSSIAKWETLEQDFPQYRVIKRGVEGGLLMPQLLEMIDTDVIPNKPNAVVIYGGENDLWGDNNSPVRSPDEVVGLLSSLKGKIHAQLPKTRIVYISIKPSPLRWRISSAIILSNLRIRLMCAADSRLRFVDVFVPMLNARAESDTDFFTEDKLHMNAAGYKIWKDAVTKALK